MNAAFAGVIYTGAYLKHQGKITVGEVSSFLLYMV
jgi:hypothetical protein